jgi:AcrR family transcriptional regulator
MSVTQTKSRLSAAERREQLIDVTAQLAADEGFHRISIEAIARRAGITRPIVYEHFGDLPGLLEAMVDRENDRALAQLAEVLPAAIAGDPGEALVAALRAYLEAVRAEPARWRLVLMPSEGAPEVLRERIAAGRTGVLAALASVLGPGLDSPDPRLTAATLSAVADEAARLTLDDPAEFPVERLVSHAAWILSRLEGEGPPEVQGADQGPRPMN